MTESNQQRPLVTIGIIFGKNDLKYLPYSLKSIFNQTYTNFEVCMHNNVLDEQETEEDDKVWQWIEMNYPQVKLERSGNIGFGAAHNIMICEMQGEYYLCYNPDIILEPDFLEQLIAFLNNTKEKRIGVVGGRLMYWNFAKRDEINQGKTNQIDSLGLQIKKSHRFVDIGQGEEIKISPLVRGENKVEEVFGLSGALFLASKKALEKIAYQTSPPVKGDIGGLNPSLKPKTPLVSLIKGEYKEYFDETIFLYKEDVDLAYRLRWAGFDVFRVENAVAYHDRSVQGNSGLIASRKSKKRLVKGETINTWSFLHHHIMLYKNWNSNYSRSVKLATLFYEIISNLYLFFLEPITFWHGWKLFKQKLAEIKKRKALTAKVVSVQKIERWM